jgi:hypothetical protein
VAADNDQVGPDELIALTATEITNRRGKLLDAFERRSDASRVPELDVDWNLPVPWLDRFEGEASPGAILGRQRLKGIDVANFVVFVTRWGPIGFNPLGEFGEVFIGGEDDKGLVLITGNEGEPELVERVLIEVSALMEGELEDQRGGNPGWTVADTLVGEDPGSIPTHLLGVFGFVRAVEVTPTTDFLPRQWLLELR